MQKIRINIQRAISEICKGDSLQTSARRTAWQPVKVNPSAQGVSTVQVENHSEHLFTLS